MSMPYNPIRRSFRKGFTLIELLVVISIISLLIAILLPALGQARESARIISCATKIRQINMGYFHYADDYKEYIPPFQFRYPDPQPAGFSSWAKWDNFQHLFTPYLALPDATHANGTWENWINADRSRYPIYQCPSGHGSAFDTTGAATDHYYRQNHILPYDTAASGPDWVTRITRRNDIPRFSEAVLCYEMWQAGGMVPPPTTGVVAPYNSHNRGNNGRNVAFGDGHVTFHNGSDDVPWGSAGGMILNNSLLRAHQ